MPASCCSSTTARAAVILRPDGPAASFDEYRKWVALHMECSTRDRRPAARAHSLSRVLGSWPGPHTTDVPLKDIADLILSVNVGAYVIEGANPPA